MIMFCFEQVPEQSMNVNTETEVELTAEKKHLNITISQCLLSDATMHNRYLTL